MRTVVTETKDPKAEEVMAIPEASVTATDHGLIPDGEGWFVLNAREAEWAHSDRHGSVCAFEGYVPFAELGINLNVLQPGQPKGFYHGENSQEDFLVISGECLLVVEDQERKLKRWDFVHCPPWTDHVLIGAGTAQCVLLAVGARFEGGYEAIEIRSPIAEAALKHGAALTEETSSLEERWAVLRYKDGAYREGDLPS